MDDKKEGIVGRHYVRTGPLGAVCLAETDGALFMEARVSVAGAVVPWGIPAIVPTGG
jgi:hypothetical protein